MARRAEPWLVEQRGVAWVAKRYVERRRDWTRARPEDEWVDDAVSFGGHPPGSLPPDVWFELVVRAAEEAADVDGILTGIGDGPADHLVGEVPSMIPRLHAARATSPGVDRMFVAVCEYLRSVEETDPATTWWGDPTTYERIVSERHHRRR